MSAAITGRDLPDGWAASTLGEVCQVNPPKPVRDDLSADAEVTFVPMPAVDADSGTIATPQIRGFDEVRKGFTAFRENDVIMAKITPCMENGKAAIAKGLRNGLGFGSTEFHVCRSREAVLPEYVYYFIRQESFRSAAEMEMTGSVGQKRVPADFIESAEIPIPPLAEQKRIVDAICRLTVRADAARERLARVPTILKRFRQAILAAACSGRLTEEWRSLESESISATAEACAIERERFQLWSDARKAKAVAERRTLNGSNWQQRYIPPIALDDSELPELPASWRWASFDTFTGSFQYGPRFGEDEYVDGGVPTVRTSDMDFRGRIVLDNPPQVSIRPESADHFVLRQDDVLITRTGATIGKCALFDESIGPAIASAYLIRYRVAKIAAVPRYLLTVFMSTWGQQCLIGGTTAVAQPNVNTKSIALIPIPVPPVKEQAEIVHRVDALMKLADAIQQRVAIASARADKTTQAILAKAFRGELLPTEADLARTEGREYEPADKLLARSQATDNGDSPRRTRSPHRRTRSSAR